MYTQVVYVRLVSGECARVVRASGADRRHGRTRPSRPLCAPHAEHLSTLNHCIRNKITTTNNNKHERASRRDQEHRRRQCCCCRGAPTAASVAVAHWRARLGENMGTRPVPAAVHPAARAQLLVQDVLQGRLCILGQRRTAGRGDGGGAGPVDQGFSGGCAGGV